MPKLLTLFFIFSLYQISFSQIRIYSNEFLAIGTGAGELAMAGAVTATSENIYSTYWNPAGLNFIKNKYEAGIMHSEYFAGTIKYDYAGFAYKTNDSAVIAGSIIRFGTDNIPNTLELIDENGNIDYDRISYFSVADWAFIFSYAKKTKINGLSYGINSKIIFRNMGEFAKAYGFGFDLGIKYTHKKWNFGANIKDVTSTFNAWFYNNEKLENVFLQTGNELPENGIETTIPEIYLGAARNFKISEKFNLQPQINLDISFDGKKYVLISSDAVSIDPYFGAELNFKNIIFVRTGVGNIAEIPDFDQNTINFQPSLGIGLKIFNFSLDYALTDIGDKSIALYSNIFSLSYGFNKIKIKSKTNKSNFFKN